jgi:ubiquinone/menaquinone biosynthesis C-methylase UbiE/3-isopropylmalate dehydratase small subunit
VFLASPETCAASALTGVITDPRTLGDQLRVEVPEKYLVEDNMVVPPAAHPEEVEVVRGPNIKPLPINKPMSGDLSGQVLLKVGDNITTDHIMPAGAKILPLRSNIPAISEYVFEKIDPSFASRAKAQGGGFVVGGSNYGQGSSREHAALAPMYLGVRGLLTKSFARIHRDNLINFGILPMIFVKPEDYDDIAQGDELRLDGAKRALESGEEVLTVKNLTKDHEYEVRHNLTPRQAKIVLAGGLLNFIRQSGDASNIEREATASAHGSTTALPTRTTKATDVPGDKPRPLGQPELFDMLVIERASDRPAEHDNLGHGLHEKTDHKLADLIAPKPGDQCLDVATATGTLAISLADKVGSRGKVVAVDLAEGMLQYSERKARAHKLKNVEFQRMDAQQLEFEDATFDVVGCSLAIFYFPDIEGALKGFLRVLKPGGTVGLSSADAHNAFSPLSEPYMASLEKTAREMDIQVPAYPEAAELTRTKKGLEQLLKQAGFTDIEIHEEKIPVRFTSPEDWWSHGRGSTWGDLVLEAMTEQARAEFKARHFQEIAHFFDGDGVKAETPILLAVARKQE